jgi:hypothetical protein
MTLGFILGVTFVLVCLILAVEVFMRRLRVRKNAKTLFNPLTSSSPVVIGLKRTKVPDSAVERVKVLKDRRYVTPHSVPATEHNITSTNDDNTALALLFAAAVSGQRSNTQQVRDYEEPVSGGGGDFGGGGASGSWGADDNAAKFFGLPGLTVGDSSSRAVTAAAESAYESAQESFRSPAPAPEPESYSSPSPSPSSDSYSSSDSGGSSDSGSSSD